MIAPTLHFNYPQGGSRPGSRPSLQIPHHHQAPIPCFREWGLISVVRVTLL